MATLRLQTGALITTSNNSIIQQYLAQGAVEYKPIIDAIVKDVPTIIEETKKPRGRKNK